MVNHGHVDAATLPTLYKFLRIDGCSPLHRHQWSLPLGGQPGEWNDCIDDRNDWDRARYGEKLTPLGQEGFHANDGTGLREFMSDLLFVVEYKPGTEVYQAHDGNYRGREMRLVRQLNWSRTIGHDFVTDCIVHAFGVRNVEEAEGFLSTSVRRVKQLIAFNDGEKPKDARRHLLIIEEDWSTNRTNLALAQKHDHYIGDPFYLRRAHDLFWLQSAKILEKLIIYLWELALERGDPRKEEIARAEFSWQQQRLWQYVHGEAKATT